MNTSVAFIIVVLGCAIVTWLPRILPFIIVKNVQLPPIVMKWLSYIPICILTALIVEHVWQIDTEGTLSISIDFPFIAALIITLITAIWSKSLAITVIVGVVTMALIRFFL